MAGFKIFKRIRELLDVDWSNIAEGQFLRRVGDKVTGDTPTGATGASGHSGYSGFSGISGFSGDPAQQSGYSGYSGDSTSGYSGYSGSGLSGYSGFCGLSGYSGYSGSGVSGYSGYSGYSGSGISGFSGFSGSGLSGYSGFCGLSGYSGSGTSGYSGYSGTGSSGYSGYSGGSGYSGYCGLSGYSGFCGLSGYSGFCGLSGYSGYSGTTGTSGFSGFSGVSTSGYSGYCGLSGYSGYCGLSGYSGYSGSGVSGYSGFSGSGLSGYSGYCGTSGYSGFCGLSGYSGFSGGTGSDGQSGYSGYSGGSGYSGFCGLSGYSGYSGSGLSGYSGFCGLSGYSGYSGSGLSGYSGFCGSSGYSGFCGLSGYSGYSSLSGYSGFCGHSGYSGFSGSGVSGYSGYSGVGLSGYSGYSGLPGTGLTSRGPWDIGTEYITNDLVTYNGAAWLSLQDGNLGNTPVEGAFWTLFSAQGTSGFSGYSGYSGSGKSGYSGYSGWLGIVGAQPYWFQDTASDITDYHDLSAIVETGVEIAESAVVNNSTVLIRSFVTPELGVTTIPSGEWAFDFFGYASSLYDISNFFVEIYVRATDTTETLLFDTTSPPILNTSVDEYKWSTIEVEYSCNATDRLVCKVYATTIHDDDVTIYFAYLGEDHYSHFLSTFTATEGGGGPGTSGYSGYSGFCGLSGYSGYCGLSGYSGYSGSGISGYSGYSGKSGYSGFSGNSTSGYSGYSGPTGPLTQNLDFGGFKGVNSGTPTTTLDLTNKTYVDDAIAAASSTPSSDSRLISGGGVVWTGNLNFTVSAATYLILGTTYSSPQTNITLSAADATFTRIDVIAVDSSNAVVVITGTAAASPIAPNVDPSTQLQLTFIQIAANATTPSNIANTLLYDENVGSAAEWNATSSGAGFNVNSSNNPAMGSKDIEATAVTTSNYVDLAKGSGTIDPSTQNSLAFYIRSKATWATNRSLTIRLANAGVQVGNSINFKDGSYGFVSSNTSSYQQILIPISNFSAGSSAVNQLRFTVGGTGGSIGFYLDNISFQTGVSINTQTFMNWRGTWSSSIAYVKNDVITYNGIGYVCLVANTNSTPTSTNTNWQAFGNPIRTVGCSLDGGGAVLTTGKVKGFFTCPIAGKITGYSIGLDAGTATLKTWKVATGTAVPTVSNSISSSGVSISSGTYVRSTTVSDFTSTTVTAGDIFAFNLSSVTSATELTFLLEITPQ